MIADNIVAIANAYAKANITEIQVNNGWTNKAYENDMVQLTGWYPGAEWCAAAAILDWKKGYVNRPDMLGHINRLFSLNSQDMANKFHADPIWPTSTNVPKLGAIVVWAEGDSSSTGHTGIVVAIDPDGIHFTSVEGNTSSPSAPETRTGWTVAAHIHQVGLPHSSMGLNLDRFIYAIEEYIKP